MVTRTNGRGRDPNGHSKTNYLNLRRANLSTTVNPVNSCDHCGRQAARLARHVTAPGGAAGYLCRSCYSRLRAIETRAVEVDRARRELARLFRRWPPGAIRGAVAAERGAI